MENRHLFRGKRIDNGEWVEGFLMDENYINTPFNDNEVGGRFDDPVEIDESTLCQCTGLKDKNGKLIWENDIMEGHLDEEHPEDVTRTRVLWYENGWYTKEIGSIDYEPLSDFDSENFEVIGNIFDNSELLEE